MSGSARKLDMSCAVSTYALADSPATCAIDDTALVPEVAEDYMRKHPDENSGATVSVRNTGRYMHARGITD